MNPGSTGWGLAAALAVAAAAVVPAGGAAQSAGRGGGQSAAVADTTARAVLTDLAAAPRPSATAVRIEGEISVDGRLDEPAWDRARVIDDFVQQKPDEGHPATDRTEVRIVYDDEALYIGALMFDDAPDEIVVPTLQRDPNTRDGDAFGIVLDTFRDRSSGFAFYINAGGAIRDGQVADDGRNMNFAWEGIYTVRTRIHDQGWTLEMEIPWITLRYDPSQPVQRWGLNLLRRTRRKNEDATWAPMDRRWPLHTMSRAGTLGGLKGLRSRRPVLVKPFGLSARGDGTRQGGVQTELDAGLDVKYGVTSGLTLDATVNTDFSQVEVDQQQVNLTRFSLFFPERREFFLENAGIFQFGDQGSGFGPRTGASSRDFQLFFSRRIGLRSDGTPLPILGGGRLSGTAGPFEVGLLNMQTQETGEAPAENFAVARLRARPLPGLAVGGIFVNRARVSQAPQEWSGVEHNRSYGVDANYQDFGDRLIVQSYLAGTGGERVDGTPQPRDWAGRLSLEWRSPTFESMAMVRRIGTDFEPAVGFVRRGDLVQRYGLVGMRRTVDWPVIQLVNPFVEVDHYTTASQGVLETRRVTGGVGAEFWDGGEASFSVNHRFERVFDPFTVGGARIGTGDYTYTEAQARYQFNRARPVSANLRVGGGGYFDGDRRSIGGSLLARWGYRLVAQLDVDHNRIELPGTAPATADVFGLRLEAYASPTLLGSGVIQYNEATDEVVTNVRFNWRHAPLSDVFIVFTERRDRGAGVVTDRLVTLKVTRLFAL